MKKTIELLNKIGLTPTQADLYLLLRNYGQLRIHEIVELSNVPRSTIYDNLEELYALGLATTKIHNNYKQIIPLPVESMAHNLQEKLSYLHELKTGLDLIGQQNQGSSNFIDIRFYEGVAGVRQLFWNSLQARDTIFVQSQWGRSKHVGAQFYANFVRTSKERGFKERVLINDSPATFAKIKRELLDETSRSAADHIRYIPGYTQIIGDCFTYNEVYVQMYLQGKRICGFEIHNKEFVASQRAMFKYLWKQATSISPHTQTS